MLSRFVQWIRNLNKVTTERAELIALLIQQESVIKSLNTALAESNEGREREYVEKKTWLGAFAMQAGGQVEMPLEFIRAIQEGDYSISVVVNNEKNALTVTLSLSETQPAQG